MTETAQTTAPTRRRIRILLAALLAALVLVAGGFYYFRVAMPAGSGPAGPPVPRAPFEQVWSDRPVLLLGVGDSVTAGFGASEGKSYFERLVRNPPDEFPDMKGRSLGAAFPNLTTRNVSVSGSTSPQHLRGQIEPLETQPPDVFGLVVMTTGGNDLIHNYGRTPPRPDAMYGATYEEAQPWIDQFEQRLDRIIRLLRERFPGGCHILLANIYDPTDGVGDPESVRMPAWKDSVQIMAAYNEAIERCAEKYAYVTLVDIHGAFFGHGIHCTQPWTPHYQAGDPHFWYNPNLEDPNDRGYDAVRRTFLLALLKDREAVVAALHPTSRED